LVSTGGQAVRVFRVVRGSIRKRQRAGALQDASRVPNRSEFPPGLGLRRPSAALSVSIRG
jgi:hypothetical protein